MDIIQFEEMINQIIDSDNDKKKSFENIFKLNIQIKCVLGIDIYQYSKFEINAQSIIPFILHKLINETVNNLDNYEHNFFAGYNISEFNKSFIDTGDGGFIVFNNPFQALIFAIYFSYNLLKYNTKKYLEKAYAIVGNISLRYALTMDSLYNFEDNWYGPAIITCSRTLSKDKLNRFLIDENVKTWFDHHFNGIETLIRIGLNNLETKEIHLIILKDKSNYRSNIIPEKWKNEIISNIININLSKIGTIESKGDKISIYNLHFQIYLVFQKDIQKPGLVEKFVITLGNLNVSGL